MKKEVMTVEESLVRLNKQYNGGLPNHVVVALPQDVYAVKFVPPKCAHCPLGIQLPFGYMVIRGQVVLISICAEIVCAHYQFPLLTHLIDGISKSRGGAHGANNKDRTGI